eukprot:7708856-Pyramimonas_sp.AAC.1
MRMLAFCPRRGATDPGDPDPPSPARSGSRRRPRAAIFIFSSSGPRGEASRVSTLRRPPFSRRSR